MTLLFIECSAKEDYKCCSVMLLGQMPNKHHWSCWEHCEIMCRYSLLVEFFRAAGCTPEIRFSSTIVQRVYMHTHAHTQPITISQLTSGERSKRSCGNKCWLLTFLRSLIFFFLLQTFILQLHTSRKQADKESAGIRKPCLVIFPFAVVIKASCLNDTSFHRM